MEYRVEFEVRDNEIDIQGVVNNANYFIYMAHARHKFLSEILGNLFCESPNTQINSIKVKTNFFII